MLARRAVWTFLAAVAVGSAAADQTAGRAAQPQPYAIPTEKVDSGLGNLPPLSEWREPWLYAIPAEKVDSGLGNLPPSSEWREPWLYATPAEKVDSGLGNLPPSSEWREPWLYAAPLDAEADRREVSPTRPVPAAGTTTPHTAGS